MRLSRLLFLAACLVSLARPAGAAPILIGKSDAAGEPRRDPGTGICGSVSKFNDQPTPLITIDEAIALLDRPARDSNVANRVSRLFQNMNLSVGPGSEADFRAPSYNDDAFPFCQDPMANPMGPDDNNLAMRLRGYLNVGSTLGGQPVTFVVKCDDGCALWIGKSRQKIMEANDDSPQLTGRRARSVIFSDPGLYPIELVYFQNASSGYLEWSQALVSVFAGDDVAVGNVQWNQQAMHFKPLSGVDLYSSIVGSNSSCLECGAPGMDCTAGSYCGDGLCQSCKLPDHCGPSCSVCPAGRRLCSAGQCVECTGDDMCPVGGSCDLESGSCLAPLPCTSNAQCKPSQLCQPDGFCGNPPPPCRTDAECRVGQICTCADGTTSCAQQICKKPPTACTTDLDCPMNFHCDSAQRICKINDRYLYEGGLAGCSLSSGARPGSSGWVLIALGGLAFLGIRMRTRRSNLAVHFWRCVAKMCAPPNT